VLCHLRIELIKCGEGGACRKYIWQKVLWIAPLPAVGLIGFFFGVDEASAKRTVKERSVKNALRIWIRYIGNLKEISLYKSPFIQTVS
jgi:hypothetical protein